MTIFVKDTFSGAAQELSLHTGEIGATWTKAAATYSTNAMGVDGNGFANLTVNNGNYTAYFASGLSADNNYTVDTLITHSTTQDAGLVIRQNSGSTLFAYVYQGAGQLFLIGWNASGTNTYNSNIDLSSVTLPANNTPCTFRAVITQGAGSTYNVAFYLVLQDGSSTSLGSLSSISFAYGPTSGVGIGAEGNGKTSRLVAYSNGTPITGGSISAVRVRNNEVRLTDTGPDLSTGVVTRQWKRSTTTGSGYANVSMPDTTVAPATQYYYVLTYTDSTGSYTTPQLAVYVPAINIIIEDSFAGTSNALLNLRTTATNISGDTPGAAVLWRTVDGQIGKLDGAGNVNLAYDPVRGAYVLDNITLANVESVVEVFVPAFAGSRGAITGGLIDRDSANGIYFEFGNVGFGVNNNPTARVYALGNTIQFQGGNVGGGENTYATAVGQDVYLRLTTSLTTSGLPHTLFEYKVNNGSYATIYEADLPAFGSFDVTRLRLGFSNNNFGTPDPIGYFKATYAAGIVLTAAQAELLVIGDSNSQFQVPGTLNLQPMPALVGTLITTSAGYNRVNVHDFAQSGSTTSDWNGGSLAANLAAATAVAQARAIKVAYISLGTNNAKDSLNISPPQYKTDTLAIITALKTAGVQKIVLVDPAWVNPSTSDFTGANARIQNYSAKNTELVTADSATLSQIIGLYTLTQTTPALMPDGIHYSLTNSGGTQAAQIIANGVQPPLLNQYKIPIPPAAGNRTDGNIAGPSFINKSRNLILAIFGFLRKR